MATVIICRDALEDSVLGNLALARSLARGGEQAAVIFAGDALSGLDTGTFAWSPNFQSRDARSAVIARAEEHGLPLAHKERDRRWSDIRGFVRSFKTEPNLRLIACPLWAGLLDLSDRTGYLERIDEDELRTLLKNADTIVGGY